jgi:hypothetical protein
MVDEKILSPAKIAQLARKIGHARKRKTANEPSE